jgi:hypothetical protein
MKINYVASTLRHNLECYQCRCVDQIIQCKQKFLDYEDIEKHINYHACISIIWVSSNYSNNYIFNLIHGRIYKHMFHAVWVIAIRFSTFMLRIARISRTRCHSFNIIKHHHQVPILLTFNALSVGCASCGSW